MTLDDILKLADKPEHDAPTDLQAVMHHVGVHLDAIRGEFELRIATAEHSLVADALRAIMNGVSAHEQDLLTGRTSFGHQT